MNPLTVLVVDDDFRVAQVHKAFVERVPGFSVVGVANTATEAMALAAELSPDLVLMDVYLPDGDGLEVLRTLLDRDRAPLGLVISAAGDATTVRHALQLGAIHYLVKPFGSADLADRLTAIRQAVTHLDNWPSEPSQRDVDRLFSLIHREPEDVSLRADVDRLAPTRRLILGAIAASNAPLSASQIADKIGISRATAQRYLAQLEQSALVKLELRYGSTGRPEHLYSRR